MQKSKATKSQAVVSQVNYNEPYAKCNELFWTTNRKEMLLDFVMWAYEKGFPFEMVKNGKDFVWKNHELALELYLTSDVYEWASAVSDITEEVKRVEEEARKRKRRQEILNSMQPEDRELFK